MLRADPQSPILKPAMRVTFAIGVCNESRELENLLHYLLDVEKVCENGDDVNVLVDTSKVDLDTTNVLAWYGPRITTCEREFDGNFSEHRNFHIEQCTGDVIFMLDADEIPQSQLVHTARAFDERNADILYVPRINICPGYTKEWLARHKFSVTNTGFINWPDFQGRIFRNDPKIRWKGDVHEKLAGSERIGVLRADPELALWHVKSLQRQDKQNAHYDELAGKTP